VVVVVVVVPHQTVNRSLRGGAQCTPRKSHVVRPCNVLCQPYQS